MTNNGDIINKMMRAGNCHEKEYKVTVNKEVTKEFVRKMSEGVPILDTVTRPCKVEKTGKYKFRIILTQGLNRQIRRMCEYFWISSDKVGAGTGDEYRTWKSKKWRIPRSDRKENWTSYMKQLKVLTNNTVYEEQ